MNEQAEGPAAVEAEINGEILIRRRHRRQPRRESSIRRVWRGHRWEIIGALALILGVFLAFGPLARWVQPAPAAVADGGGEPVDMLAVYLDKIATAITTRLDQAAGAMLNFMALSNWAVKAGYVLLAFAVVMIPLRARWWLLHDSPWLLLRCPQCGSAQIHRVHRRAWERLVARAVPIRRYRCPECRWRGIRIDNHGAPPVRMAASSRD